MIPDIDKSIAEHPFVLLLQEKLRLPIGRCTSIDISVGIGLLPNVTVEYYNADCTRHCRDEYILHSDYSITVLVHSEVSLVSLGK